MNKWILSSAVAVAALLAGGLSEAKAQVRVEFGTPVYGYPAYGYAPIYEYPRYYGGSGIAVGVGRVSVGFGSYEPLGGYGWSTPYYGGPRYEPFYGPREMYYGGPVWDGGFHRGWSYRR